MSRNGQIDWGFGELLALGSLLLEGTPVRLAGQDARRGTFVSAPRGASTTARTARSGCRWRTSPTTRRASGSTTRCSASTRPWASSTATRSSAPTRSCSGRRSSATSPTAPRPSSTSSSRAPSRSGASARASCCCCRTATRARAPTTRRRASSATCSSCAENNMTVARPSTPASYFHLLRRQAYARPRRPLIVFTPKSMLRLRGATSEVADFTSGQFEPVLDDARDHRQGRGRSACCCTPGKIHYDLLGRAREARRRDDDRARAPRAVLPAARSPS